MSVQIRTRTAIISSQKSADVQRIQKSTVCLTEEFSEVHRLHVVQFGKALTTIPLKFIILSHTGFKFTCLLPALKT